MNNNAKKNLLLFFSDESCPEALAAVPTLAFLAKNKGIDFETYICKTAVNGDSSLWSSPMSLPAISVCSESTVVSDL